MRPPIDSCRGALNGQPCQQTPLTKWRVVKTYDTDTECEYIRDEEIEKGERYLGEFEPDMRSLTKRVSFRQAEYSTWTAAICIATDDPLVKDVKPD